MTAIEWMRAYGRHTAPSLPRTATLALWTYADNQTLLCWPTLAMLASITGLGERQVVRQLNANIKAGWITRKRRGVAGRATVYELTLPGVRLTSSDLSD